LGFSSLSHHGVGPISPRLELRDATSSPTATPHDATANIYLVIVFATGGTLGVVLAIYVLYRRWQRTSSGTKPDFEVLSPELQIKPLDAASDLVIVVE